MRPSRVGPRPLYDSTVPGSPTSTAPTTSMPGLRPSAGAVSVSSGDWYCSGDSDSDWTRSCTRAADPPACRWAEISYSAVAGTSYSRVSTGSPVPFCRLVEVATGTGSPAR